MTFKSKILQELDWRGFLKDSNDFENLDKVCHKAEQDGTGITLYTGYDLTAKSLHAGNLMTLMMLRHFQKFGHKVIALLGGATTQIGDPTGKDAMRKPLTDAQIQENLDGINKNFSQILLHTFEVVNNNDWLGKKGYLEILKEAGAYISLSGMMAMESVQLRLDRGHGMSFLEFNYMLFQAYDFYHLAKTKNCVLQIGGSDQWGNIIQGVKLANRLLDIETFALTCPLITRADGGKMGKSVDGAVWLSKESLSHFEYFQYFRNIDDRDVGKFLRFFTELAEDEIQNLESKKGKEVNEAKKILAFEATKVCHGEELANEAMKFANEVFEEKNQSGTMEEVIIKSANIVDILIEIGFAISKSAAKTLIKQNSVKINGETCKEIGMKIEKNSTIQIGKKKFVRVIVL